jgi:formylmethanofuran dehydrogenase subunit E
MDMENMSIKNFARSSINIRISSVWKMNIGQYTFDEFKEAVRKFHGYVAPGIIIGGYMVEKAKRALPEGVTFDAAVETVWCLPDAVQLLTPCTIGNGWLKIFDFGKFALSLYDKIDGKGARAHLDISKLDACPAIKTWFLKLKPRSEQDTEKILEEIRHAGDSICTVKEIVVLPEHLARRKKDSIAICKLCGEAFPSYHGDICLVCKGQSPYVIDNE